ncbi:RHS repeat-associated core domain-containing protein [Gimesia panareensis]|uniref:RHS repeat-associated core domain-containing protein n=1 Tax=Gimesia panareensis TaxID=2527978 RepID=UPI00118CF5A0|nr:RHS repeat-associated core domain-containing protein [Gimesia panareensis]QDU53064.1 Putative deoxyribonuclease RhsC [Gimesia panareensis]
MRFQRFVSVLLFLLVLLTFVTPAAFAQAPRNVYEWTPEKVLQRAWLAERDELAANVYVHSPERGYVQTGRGNYCLPVTDLVINATTTELRIERLYTSDSRFRGRFGLGWHSSLDASLSVGKNNIVEVNIGGIPYRFQIDPANPTLIKPLQTSTASLTKAADGSFLFTAPEGIWDFTASGQLRTWQKQGTIFSFSYQGNQLTQIRAGDKVLLEVTTNPQGQITQLIDDDSRTQQYQYDSAGHLQQVKNYDRTSEVYQFDTAGHLSEIRFRNGSKMTMAWDSQGHLLEMKGPGLKRSAFAFRQTKGSREMIVTLPGEIEAPQINDFSQPLSVPETPEPPRSLPEPLPVPEPVAQPQTEETKEETIFYNANDQGVLPQPTQPTQFTLKTPIRLTYMMNYHWTQNNEGTPGTIALKHENGTMYGPWQTHAPREGGRPNNAIWECAPDVLLIKGTYTVLDSQPETWAQNQGTGGRGITEIRGIKLKANRLVPALDPTGRWYQHGENDYRFLLPPGWHVEENTRNKVQDEIFDTVVNRDRSLILICWKGHEDVKDAQTALQQYVKEKEQEVKQNPQIAPTVGSRYYQLVSVPAARVGYYLPGRKSAVFRISFVSNNRRHVINVIKTGSARLDEPSPELASLFNSFEFHRPQPVKPAAPKPPLPAPPVVEPLPQPDLTPPPVSPATPTQAPALAAATLSWKYDDKVHSVEMIDFEENATKKYYDPTGKLIRYVRPDQSQMTFAYDSQGRLISKTRYDQTREQYTYDGQSDRLASVTGQLGKVDIRYNTQGLIQEFIDAHGVSSRFDYDPQNQLRGVQRSDGESVAFAFDSQGELQQMTFDGNETLQLTTSDKGLKKTLREPNGASETLEFTNRGELRRETDALGQTTSFQYGPGGQMTSHTNALGQTTRYAHDSAGNIRVISHPGERGKVLFSYNRAGSPQSMKLPGGQEYRFEFNPVGKMTKTIDPLGRSFGYEFNRLQQLSKMTFPDGTSRNLVYDAAGRLVSDQRSHDPATTYRYDERDRLVEVTSGSGSLRYEYDDYDRPVRVVDLWSGQLTALRYDQRGRLIELNDSFRGRTTCQYDDSGRMIAVQNTRGQQVEFAYRDTELPTERRQSGGETVRYEYDLLGQLKREDSTVTGTRRYDYDALNRPKEIISPTRGTRRYEYDIAGNLSLVQTGQSEYRYEYDSADNLKVINAPGGGQTRFDYDDVGRVLSRTNALGQRRQYRWNAADQLEEQTREDGKQLSYTYDKSRHPVQVKAGETVIRSSEYNTQGLPVTSTVQDQRYRYLYDRAGKLLEMRNEAQRTSVGYTYGNGERVSSVLLPEGKSINYRYDQQARLTGVTGPSGAEVGIEYDEFGRRKALIIGQSARIEYAYHPNGLLQGMKCSQKGGKVIYQATYDYDSAGRIIRAVLQDKTFTYAYDTQGRLSETVYPDGRRESYEYDLAGNLKQRGTEERKFNRMNQLLNAGETTLQYSLTGNLISRSNPKGATRYEYDALDLLQRVDLQNSKSIEYAYDPDGLLASRNLAGKSTQFLQDRKNIVGELTDGKLDRVYLNGDDLDQRFGQVIGDEQYYFITAPDHSVLAVINQKGELVNSYTYSPCGEVNVIEEQVPNRFFAKGRYLDRETGLYHYRSRWYDAALSVFISADTEVGTLADPVTQNAYLYLNGEPVNQIDPEGTTGIPAPGTVGADWLKNLPFHKYDPSTPLHFSSKMPVNQWLTKGMRHHFEQIEAIHQENKMLKLSSLPAATGASATVGAMNAEQQAAYQSLRAAGFPSRMTRLGRLRLLGSRAAPWLGKGLIIYGVGNSMYNIYQAKDHVDQTKREVSVWGAVWVGAKIGGAWGATAGGIGAVPGSIIGAITGYLGSKLVTDPQILFDDDPELTGENQIYIVPIPGKKGEPKREVFVEFMLTGEEEKMAAKVTLHLPITAKDAAKFKQEFGIGRKLTFFAEKAEDGYYVIEDERFKEAIRKLYTGIAKIGVAVGMGFAEGFGGLVVPGGANKAEAQKKIDAAIAGIRVTVHEAQIWIKPEPKKEKLSGSINLDVTLEIPGQKPSRKTSESEFQGRLAKPQ